MSTQRGPSQSETIGPYALEAIIGAGGFGTVYRAHDGEGRVVALKVLAPHVDSEETLRRFEREGTIRIEHPNVVRVIDAGSADGASYIAFELLEGRPLNAVLEEAPLAPERVVDMGLQICRGLEAAHARGVVHRDLKPGNVFACNDGTLKVLDFGIARPMSNAGPQLTMAGSVIGTPGYLAPEQAKGELGITAATDLWSLGVILYQAASGTSPFMRSTAVATILAVVLEEPPPLGQIGPPLPRGMAEIIHRCLHKEPRERWPSAEALRSALEALDLEGSRIASVPAELAPSIPHDEQRVVALLLAVDVHDLAALEGAVREWGGELIPMLGGQAIGVFGGRTYEGDEALRAVSAAVLARDAARFVAVASGRATGADGTVSGEVVREVERLVEAKLAGVAIDARVARAVTSKLDVRRVRADLYEAPTTFRTIDTGTFAAVRDDLPLLDREVELAQLDLAMEMAFTEERAAVVWAHGPPGIGKSRLRGELERRLKARGVPMLTSRGESHRRDAAFHLLAGAIRSDPSLEPLFLDASVSAERRRRALEDTLALALEDPIWARQCIEPVARLVGLPDALEPSTTHRRSDPQLMADRARISLTDVLSAMAAHGPFAIVLDDVQWADDASLALLDELAGRLARRPLLIFVAARSELGERHPELFALREVLRIGPRGLSARAVATLAASIARRAVPPAIVDEIATRTGGNPFFVEQIVRELCEQNLLDGALESLPIPIDVEGAVQSRLDHLPGDEKLLCKRAAIYNGAFTEPALVALESPDPAQHLGSLARRGLLGARAVSADGTEREYRFKNALVAEVAYRMNSEEARRELHRAAATFLSTIAGADREELARHQELGGQPERAAKTYAEAAARAARRGDSKSVLRCGERAIALGLSGHAALELHLACADACAFLGRRDEQRRGIEAAIALADTPPLEARALTEKAGFLAAIGAHDEGLEVAELAVRTAREVGDEDVLATALARRSWLLLYSGKVAEAAEAISEASGMSARLAPETAAFVAVWRGQLVTAMGDLGKRKAAYEEGIARFREIGDLRRAASAECNLADTYNRVGAYEEAEAALREAVRSCQKVGNRVVEGYALCNLGYALAGQERWDEALETFDGALALAAEIGRPRLALAIRLYRARASLDAGRGEVRSEARLIAEEARAELLPALEATALAVASRAALETNDVAAALTDAERAMALRDEIGAMEEDEAEVFLALSGALFASGRRDEAREVVARGAARLEYLAGRIADADWRARFLVEVPLNRRLIELDGASE